MEILRTRAQAEGHHRSGAESSIHGGQWSVLVALRSLLLLSTSVEHSEYSIGGYTHASLSNTGPSWQLSMPDGASRPVP